MKRNKLIALFAGLSLAFVGSAALAAPSADTLLVAGYDSDQMAVLYGVSGIDQEGDEATLDCTLTGDFVYELDAEAEDDAVEVAVTGLKTSGGDGEEDGDVEFFFENDEEESDEAVSYQTVTESDEPGTADCALTSVTIEPNGEGEINHGTVVSTFAKLLNGGNGCLIRHFAQSDFGKGDYDPVDGVDAESFEVTLQSIETACDKKNKVDSTELDGDDAPKGKDSAPGQSKDKPAKGKDNAPGQQKKNND